MNVALTEHLVHCQHREQKSPGGDFGNI